MGVQEDGPTAKCSGTFQVVVSRVPEYERNRNSEIQNRSFMAQ